MTRRFWQIFLPVIFLLAPGAVASAVADPGPFRFAGSPSYVMARNTTSATLSLETDRNATCKFSTTASSDFTAMTAFATTGAVSHKNPINGLTNGASYYYYVKCADASGLQNSADYAINFSVPSTDLQTVQAAPVFGVSNITISNVTTTSAVVSWTTSVPTTGQVFQVDNTLSAEMKRYPDLPSPSFSTSHSVAMTNLYPGTTYKIYVVSMDAGGQIYTDVPSVYAIPAPVFTTFTTTAASGGATSSFRIDTVGPKNVYAGDDLYFTYRPIALSGSIVAPWVYPVYQVSGLPASITPHVMCAFNAVANNDAADNWGNNGCYDRTWSTIRLRVDASTTPGAYTASFVFKDGANATASYAYSFNVLPRPSAFTPTPPTSFPLIPGVENWQSNMNTWGQYHCGLVMQYGAGVALDTNALNTWWYYDGGRVFLQIADYTGDYATYVPCAQRVFADYANYVHSNNGQIAGWRKFPQGLAMNYWRYGGSASGQAVVDLYRTSANVSIDYGALADPGHVRELSYGIDDMIYGELIGQPHNPYLEISINAALGLVDQFFVSNPRQSNQSFFTGKLLEALISYYQLTGDSRIPPAIKTALDWTWNNSVDPVTHKLAYDAFFVPMRLSITESFNNLVLPAWAWYWSITGDDTYRAQGDILFQYGTDAARIVYGKWFNQNFAWSFDYVRYRSGFNVSTISRAGNPAFSSSSTAPVVSAVTVSNVTASSADISWVTDLPADSQLDYGTTSAYGQSLPSNNIASTRHRLTVSGLTQGATFHFRARSRSQGGGIANSSDSIFTVLGVPAAPSAVSATARPNGAVVSFTPGPDGGSSILAYKVISNSGNTVATGTGSPITLTGLTSGVAVTFTVVAANAVGDSLPSASSNAVIPLPPAAPNVTAQFGIALSAAALNRATNRMVQTVTLSNNGAALAAAALVIDGLASGVSQFSPSGTTAYSTPAGSPFTELGVVAAGAQVKIKVEYVNPSNVPLSFKTRVIGAGSR